MPFFRRPFDRREFLARPAANHDVTAILALGYRAYRRYLTSHVEEIAELFHSEPTAVLEYDDRVVGVAQAGWRLPPNAWLRAIILDSRIEPSVALPTLLRQLHGLLPTRGIKAVYITLDEWNAPWLRGGLEAAGYGQVMNVWTYDKDDMEIPSPGNQLVAVRRARHEDIPAVLRLDAACFPAPWGKGEEILGPALVTAPYFAIAEWGGEVIGYSYVTVHEAGLRAHLVRVAVDPAFQGQAIGVRLLAEVVRFCRSRRVGVISLNTQDHNTAAQRLYEWFGFRGTGETQTVLGFAGLDSSANDS
jgi:[ribosomal protein S18]-alanine N-acetyltransferase